MKFVSLNGRLCAICGVSPRFFHERQDGTVACCKHEDHPEPKAPDGPPALPSTERFPAGWDSTEAHPGPFFDRAGARITFRQWVACTEDDTYRWVAHDQAGGRVVATYWVGLPMGPLSAGDWVRLIEEGRRPDDAHALAQEFAEDAVPLTFETVVPALRINRRYPTEEAARAGHAECVRLLRLDSV